MVKSFKRGFALSDLWVTRNASANDFVLSSWQRGESLIPMLVVRLALASVSTSILIWSVIHAPQPYWLIYLTNWGLTVMTATMLSALTVSLVTKCRGLSYESSALPWYMSMYWLLSNVNVACALLITTLYWALLFDNEAPREAETFGLDISTHAVNSGMALIELLVSRTPVKFAHIYQPLGFGLWYAAFTVIYFVAGGLDEYGNPYVYNVLDWREAYRTSAVIGMSTLGILVIYFLLWIVVKGRDKLSEAKIRTTSQDLPLAPPLTPEPCTEVRIV